MEITKTLLVRNAFLNSWAQILPLFIYVFTIPYIVHGLGTERFGIFAIIKIVVDYFSVFDLGLGIATTKFTAEALGKGDDRKAAIIYWTSLVFVAFTGIIAATIFYLFAPALAISFLKVNPDLLTETKEAFAISSPLVFTILIKSVLNGVLEARQRFDLINSIKIPYILVSSLIPVAVIYFGYGLRTVIVGLIAGEVAFSIGLFLLSANIIRAHHIQFLDSGSLKSMLSFGGLLIIQKVTTWIMFNIHSVIIGSLLSVTAVTYFNIPYSLTSKIGIIGACITPVIFPALSVLCGIDREKMLKLFAQSLKYTAILYGLPTLIVILFARQIIVLWLGNDFQQSIIVMRLLTIGMFLGGISWIFSIPIQVTNPGFLTVLTLFQAPFYILATWYLTKIFGITGTACAWCLWVATSVIAFCVYLMRKNILVFRPTINGNFIRGLLGIALVLCINTIIKVYFVASIGSAIINASILIAGYSIVTWYYFIDNKYKTNIRGRINNILSW